MIPDRHGEVLAAAQKEGKTLKAFLQSHGISESSYYKGWPGTLDRIDEMLETVQDNDKTVSKDTFVQDVDLGLFLLTPEF